MSKQFMGDRKKPNNKMNGVGLEECMALHRERERKVEKYPLRINKTTVIYVKKEKCNEAYAEEYRQRIKKFSLHD